MATALRTLFHTLKTDGEVAIPHDLHEGIMWSVRYVRRMQHALTIVFCSTLMVSSLAAFEVVRSAIAEDALSLIAILYTAQLNIMELSEYADLFFLYLPWHWMITLGISGVLCAITLSYLRKIKGRAHAFS